MPVQISSLEYQVGDDGRVHTRGEYHIATQAEWDALRPMRRSRTSVYKAAFEEVRAGRIVRFDTADYKQAWNIARNMRKHAKDTHLAIECRYGAHETLDGQYSLMVRSTSD